MSFVPKKIFIVDDADFMVEMLRVLFSEAGHKIIGTALSGIEAVAKIEELGAASVPDVVTIDFHMPKMDGMETIRRLRAIVPTAKFLVVSAHATMPVAMRARETGVDAFIIKPFEPQAILDAVNKL